MKYLLFSLIALLSLACDNDEAPRTTSSADPVRFTIVANSGGCGDFQFYHYSDDRTYGLQLLGDSAELNLSADWQTYAPDQTGLSLKLYQFSEPLDAYFCDDVVEANEDPLQTWDAQEGAVQLRIGGPGNMPGIYTIDVVLENVLVNDRRLDRIARNGIEVGLFPG